MNAKFISNFRERSSLYGCTVVHIFCVRTTARQQLYFVWMYMLAVNSLSNLYFSMCLVLLFVWSCISSSSSNNNTHHSTIVFSHLLLSSGLLRFTKEQLLWMYERTHYYFRCHSLTNIIFHVAHRRKLITSNNIEVEKLEAASIARCLHYKTFMFLNFWFQKLE